MVVTNFVSVLVVPLLIFSLTAKFFRSYSLDVHPNILVEGHFYLLEILIYTAFWSLFSLVANYAVGLKNRTLKYLYIYIMLLTIGILWSIELFTYLLFEKSGVLLDWQTIKFGLDRLDASISIIAQESGLLILFLLGLPIIIGIITTYLGGILKRNIRPVKHFNLFFVTVLLLLCFSVAHAVFADVQKKGSASGVFLYPLLTYFEVRDNQENEALRSGEVAIDIHNFDIERNKGLFDNIAIIILESTRAHSVDPYVKLGITNTFAKLSEEGVLATQAYTTSPHTSRAIYSILCGAFPNPGNGIIETLPNGITKPCLPHILTKANFKSAYFQSATENFEYRRQLVKNMGFGEFYPLESFDTEGYEKANYFGYEDNIMLPKSEEWLENLSGNNFIATYLTVTPHFHYDPISRYGWEDYEEKDTLNAYLNTLNYQDRFLANLIQQYKKLGLYEKTLFVIVGDHGEAFKEHKYWGHGNALYQEIAWVPMLFHTPGLAAKSITQNVSLLDILPSSLDALGIDVIEKSYEGWSLFNKIDENRDIFLECIIDHYCSALIDGKTNHKYIHNFGRFADKLYNLEKDPFEKNNLLQRNYAPSSKGLEFKNRLLEKRDSYRLGEQLVSYDSWGLAKNRVKKVIEIPKRGNKLDFNLVSGNENYAPVKVLVNRKSIKKGDDLLVSLYFKYHKPMCVKIEIDGTKRHKTRKSMIGGIGSPYFVVDELISVSKKARNIRLNVNGSETCEDESQETLYFESQATLSVDSDSTKIKEPSVGATYSLSSPNPKELKSANDYLNYLLMRLPYDKKNRGIESEEFISSVREQLAIIELNYGRFVNYKLTEVWQNTRVVENRIYRYKLNYAKNKSIDVRIKFGGKGQLLSMYYYHPWSDKVSNLK